METRKKTAVMHDYLGFEEPQNDTPGRRSEGAFNLFSLLDFSSVSEAIKWRIVMDFAGYL